MATPCTHDPNEVIEKVVSAKVNADKFDRFVNGSDTQTVQLGTGTPTPTIRNAVRQIMADAAWARQYIADAPDGDVSLNNAATMNTYVSRTLAERFADIVNVKDYGAKGDGVTDDTEAIQAALDKTGFVFAPVGTYVVSELVIKSNTHFFGAGIGKTVISAASPTLDVDDNSVDGSDRLAQDSIKYAKNALVNEHCHLRDTTDEDDWVSSGYNVYDENIYIGDMTVDMHWWYRHTKFISALNHGMTGVMLGGVKDVLVERVKCIDCGLHGFNTKAFPVQLNPDGYTSHDAVPGRSKRVTFRDCEFYGSLSDDGFTTHHSDDIVIERCKSVCSMNTASTGRYIATNQNGFEIDDGSRNCHVIDCYGEGFGKGFAVASHPNQLPCRDVVFEKCYSKNNMQGFNIWKGANDGSVVFAIEHADVDQRIVLRDCTVDGLVEIETESGEDGDDNHPIYIVNADSITIDGFLWKGTTANGAVFSLGGISNAVFKKIYIASEINTRNDNASPYGLFRILNSSNIKFFDLYIENETTRSNIIRENTDAVCCIDGFAMDSATSTATNLLCARDDSNNYVSAKCTFKNIKTSGLKFASLLSSSAASFGITQEANNEAMESVFLEKAVFRNTTGQDRPQIELSYIDGGGDSKAQIEINSNAGIYIGKRVSGTYTGLACLSSEGNFFPITSNAQSLGTSTKKWSEVFAGTGTINTSDEREKTVVEEDLSSLMKAWGRVRFKIFQFNDAIEFKGADKARMHVGLVAQEVRDAFATEGLDASRFGLYCYDKWDDEFEEVEVIDREEVVDENGIVVSDKETHIEKRKIQSAGDAYGIRYGEALALECAYQRWRMDQIEARLNEISGEGSEPE